MRVDDPATTGSQAPTADVRQPTVGVGAGNGAVAALAKPPTRDRRIGVTALIWVTAVLAVVGIFAVWANRQMLNPTNWSNTSTKLLQNAAIREATSNYLVDQLYTNVNVEGEIKAKLPANLQSLAGPIAGGVRSLATEA